MMKKTAYGWLGLTLWLALSTTAPARETLAQGVPVSGVGGPFLETGAVAGETAVFAGGWGAALFDSGFYLGGAGTGLIGTIADGHHFGYGALLVGYAHRPQRLWHPAVELQIGSGGIRRAGMAHHDSVWVLVPSLAVHLNTTPYLEGRLALLRRQVFSSDTPELSNTRLSAWILQLSLGFGRFP